MTENKKKIKLVINPDERYRASIFRSNKSISVQIVDDKVGNTLTFAATSEIKERKKPTELAFLAGKLLAEKAKKMNLQKICFDRGKYRYHGRVKAIAEGMRDGGLIF
jgi:large subunit ribosomal protein L18